MDISKAADITAAEDVGVVLPINDVEGEPALQDDGVTPVTMTVIGIYSARYRKALDDNQKWWRSLGRRKPSKDEIEHQSLIVMASAILAWEGFTQAGQPYPLTRENAVALLKAAPWIKEQVAEKIQDHAAFFPKPSPSSVSA